MPVVVIFYGFMVFAFDEYDRKGALMAESRHQAMRTALHQCQGGEASAAETSLDGVPSYDAAVRADYVGGILANARLRSYVETRGMKATARAVGTATNAHLSRLIYTRAMASESQFFCVPRTLGGNGNGFVAPARQGALDMVEQAIGPVLRLLRAILNERI